MHICYAKLALETASRKAYISLIRERKNQMKIIQKLKWVKDVDTDFDYLNPHISYRLYVGNTDTNYSVTPLGYGYKDHICNFWNESEKYLQEFANCKTLAAAKLACEKRFAKSKNAKVTV